MSSQLLVSAEEYFHHQVSEAQGHLQINLDPDSESYLVRLLLQFIGNEEAASGLRLLDMSLFELYQMAQSETQMSRRLCILKDLGDLSLYVSGFFQDSFNRKTFNLSYYIDMGSLAYQGVSDLSASKKRESLIFRNLGRDFLKLVDVLAEVSDFTRKQSNRDILALYDRWIQTQSDRALRLLKEEGIDPLPINLKLAQ